MVKKDVELTFFSTQEPTNQPFDIYFRQTLLGVVEDTPDDSEIKEKFKFLLATRLLSDLIAQACAPLKSLRSKCEIVEFESVTWTLLVASTKFFPVKRQANETQALHSNLVTHKFAS